MFKKGLLISLMVCILAMPVLVFAQEPKGDSLDTITKIVALFVKIVQWIFIIVFILAVLYIVINGLKWVTSGGDGTKVAEARQGLLYGLVGIAVIIGVWVLVSLVANVVGVDVSITNPFSGVTAP